MISIEGPVNAIIQLLSQQNDGSLRPIADPIRCHVSQLDLYFHRTRSLKGESVENLLISLLSETSLNTDLSHHQIVSIRALILIVPNSTSVTNLYIHCSSVSNLLSIHYNSEYIFQIHFNKLFFVLVLT